VVTRRKGNNKDIVRKTVAYTKDAKVSDVTRFLLTENPYILSGFREYTECSFWECSKSTFHIHNDTMNIWTHLLPAFWAVAEGVNVYTSPFYIKAHYLDKFMFFTFLFCTMLCFLASTAYHVYRSHSVRMFHTFLVLDVGSIALQLFGSVTLMAYFELQCYPDLRRVWLCAVFLWFIVSIVAVPFLLKRKMTSTRTFLLTAFALSGLAANILSAYFRNFTFTDQEIFVLIHVLVCYSVSGIGLVIRRIKVPELFAPGSFDIWLGSHQIFHLCVAMGPVSILRGYSTFLVMPPCIV
jgi:adiponectin receptor